VKLLLDSHALLWMMTGDERLTPSARTAVTRQAEISYVSAASAWEITTKHRLGKLPSAAELAADFETMTEEAGFAPLSVTLRHAQLAGKLEGSHKDPFDRMLIAQALTDNLVLVSNETAFDAFGVSRLW
jgi:PIN domain nuclease of toxin-antitoxin system